MACDLAFCAANVKLFFQAEFTKNTSENTLDAHYYCQMSLNVDLYSAKILGIVVFVSFFKRKNST